MHIFRIPNVDMQIKAMRWYFLPSIIVHCTCAHINIQAQLLRNQSSFGNIYSNFHTTGRLAIWVHLDICADCLRFNKFDDFFVVVPAFQFQSIMTCSFICVYENGHII